MQQALQQTDPMAMLNPAQRVAAEYGEVQDDGGLRAGPLLVIAGAGTGKTMTLAHRVAHLLIAGVSPERDPLLTFTRRAAQEMTRRVESIVRASTAGMRTSPLPSGGLPWSGTFHSVANRLLRRYAHNLGLDPGFSVLDRGDSADIMDVVRHELKLTKTARRFPKKDTCLAIYSRCVNTLKPLSETLDETYPWCSDWADELAELFRHYVLRKQHSQSLDYDDLLLYWNHLVAEKEFADEIGSWFDHVLVDEYQDTNLVQADIMKALKPDGEGVTVVGDDAQSIYSFRAAEVENILGFPDQFMPSAQVITLEQNYRSTQAILDSANCLIAESERQYRKNLFSDRRDGRQAGVRHRRRRRCRGGVRRDRNSQEPRARHGPQGSGRTVSRLAPQRSPRTGTGAPQYSLREIRRAEISRGRARKRPAGGTEMGRQSEKRGGSFPRTEVIAWYGSGNCCALF